MNDQENNFDVRKFKNYLKYCTEKRIDVLKERKIRFTQPCALNDPLEFNPIIRFADDEDVYRGYRLDGITMPSKHLFAEFDVIHYQINKFGFLSLTKNPDSFEMWSYYANGHRGFMIEFKDDFYKHSCMRSKEGAGYSVKEVEYLEEYVFNIDESIDEEGRILKEKRDQLFYTKTSRWQHEQEYRMVRPLSDASNYVPVQMRPGCQDEKVYLFEFSFDCIESITFGAYMSIKNKEEIMSLCKNCNIIFFQAMISKSEKDRYGKLGKMDVVPMDCFPNILMDTITFCYDKSIADCDYIPITNQSIIY